MLFSVQVRQDESSGIINVTADSYGTDSAGNLVFYQEVASDRTKRVCIINHDIWLVCNEINPSTSELIGVEYMTEEDLDSTLASDAGEDFELDE